VPRSPPSYSGADWHRWYNQNENKQYGCEFKFRAPANRSITLTVYALDTANNDVLDISIGSTMSYPLSGSLESVTASDRVSLTKRRSGDIDRIDVFDTSALALKSDGVCADATDATTCGGVNWKYSGVDWSHGGFCATVSIKCPDGKPPTLKNGAKADVAHPLGTCP
jgi:hypothetical protein